MKDLLADVSSLVELQCARRYQMGIVLGIRETSPEAQWGTAFHAYMKSNALGKSNNPFDFAPDKTDPAQFILACFSASQKENFPIQKDTKEEPLLEYRFCVPFCETGEYKVHLAGTIDRIDLTPDGVRILDYKTTRKFKINETLIDFATRFQIQFYMWAVKHLIPRELFPFSIEKIYGIYRGVFLSHTPVRIEDTAPVYLDEDWIQSLLTDLIQKAIGIWNLSVLAYPEGMAYNLCEKCPFLGICLFRDAERIIKHVSTLSRKEYNPLTHG